MSTNNTDAYERLLRQFQERQYRDGLTNSAQAIEHALEAQREVVNQNPQENYFRQMQERMAAVGAPAQTWFDQEYGVGAASMSAFTAGVPNNENMPATNSRTPQATTLASIFREVINPEQFFREHFPFDHLKDLTFAFIREQVDHHDRRGRTFPYEYTATIVSPYYEAGTNLNDHSLTFYVHGAWEMKKVGDRDVSDSRRDTHMDISCSSNDPYLKMFGQEHIPGPINDPVTINFDGKESVWPRWMVEMGKLVTKKKLRDHSIYVEVGNEIRELGYLDPKGEKFEINSPLIWHLSPNKIVVDFTEAWEAARATRQLKRVFEAARAANLEQAETRVVNAGNELTEAFRGVELAKLGVDAYMEKMFAELEETVKTDPQVQMVSIDQRGDVHALVGPITTLNGKDYGHFDLNISRRQAWPITRDMMSNSGRDMHCNIRTSDKDFCMGGGVDDFSRLVGQGRFAGAIAYFIYRLGTPGGHPYRPYREAFQPGWVANPMVAMKKAMAKHEAGSMWHRQWPDKDLEAWFEENAPKEVVKAGKRKETLPYQHELTTSFSFDSVNDRLTNWDEEFDSDAYDTHTAIVDLAFANGLINEVFSVVDDWNDNEVIWTRPRETYRIKRSARDIAAAIFGE
jgi:hypothetical protein